MAFGRRIILLILAAVSFIETYKRLCPAHQNLPT
jgi:hypothetical protein